MGTDLLPPFVLQNYEIHEWKHACAILQQDFPAEWRDLCDLLVSFRLRRSWINTGGGRKSLVSENIDSFLYARGWAEKKFDTQIVVDGVAKQSPTHKVDCFKNRVAIEIEWNNKDPFFDRDLNNFRLLFDLRAVSVGVIITRTDELQTIFDGLGRGTSYGSSTTHMSRLLPRLDGGSGGGCPVLVVGISKKLYEEDEQ
ncbi:MAG: restriction endonuclease [Ramlibacter sp.]|nr:restriction endonuclease [Ramlibacter sp.]